jgi:beta-lactamase class A
MRDWYDYVLSGNLFKKESTLKEFNRISAMANAIPILMPDGIMGYGKGGSITWNNFNCFAIAGQMIIPKTRIVSFCFITNWSGEESTVAPTFAQFLQHSTEMIHALT